MSDVADRIRTAIRQAERAGGKGAKANHVQVHKDGRVSVQVVREAREAATATLNRAFPLPAEPERKVSRGAIGQAELF